MALRIDRLVTATGSRRDSRGPCRRIGGRECRDSGARDRCSAAAGSAGGKRVPVIGRGNRGFCRCAPVASRVPRWWRTAITSGKGYGIPTEGMVEAVRMLGRLEGILLDPVYSGKAMAGMIDLICKGELRKGETVVFLHTGGAVGLFGYTNVFDAAA